MSPASKISEGQSLKSHPFTQNLPDGVDAEYSRDTTEMQQQTRVGVSEMGAKKQPREVEVKRSTERKQSRLSKIDAASSKVSASKTN